jgi:hypothetical protein
LEPGARLVFTHGRVASPRSTAFLARSPAATITDGLDVLVQLVIEAMTTAPCDSSDVFPPIVTATRSGLGPVLFLSPGSAAAKDAFTPLRLTRSCGRFGPATLGSTVPRSKASVSVKTGSGESLVWKRPCSL